MSKFRFGDRVRHPKYGEAFFLKQRGQNAIILKKFNSFDDFSGSFVPIDELELVPHPDTARLDWIDEFCASVDFVDYYDTPTKQNTYCRVKNEINSKYYDGRSVRKAIDHAMQEQPNETT